MKNLQGHFFCLAQRREYTHSTAHQKLHRRYKELIFMVFRTPRIFREIVKTLAPKNTIKFQTHFFHTARRREYAHSIARQK